MLKRITQIYLITVLCISNSYGYSSLNNFYTTKSIQDPVYFSKPSTININSFEDTSHKSIRKVTRQKDLQDIVRRIFNPHTLPAGDVELKDTRKHFSIVPAAGYTLQTGFAVLLSGNMAYFTDTAANTKISNINSSITFSQDKQTILPLQANIWTKGNRFNFVTDFRYINYPSSIYGLGRRIDPNIGYTINYTGIKLHQTVMKAISKDLYMGVGYFYDRFFKIQTTDSLTSVDQQITRRLGSRETASGFVLRLLYDSRLNQINPKQGSYMNITYRTSEKSMGSDSTWQSVQIDARTYMQFPENSGNVLAFWMFDWLTAYGSPPYLLLPSTGWDDNYNTGRGYIQSRFRGRTMLYFEGEYRFGISRNGFLGGVFFTNIENFSSDLSAQYNKLFPGVGVGLRLKLNKYSGTNLCIDYGFGQNGSRGFFVNLGEVF